MIVFQAVPVGLRRAASPAGWGYLLSAPVERRLAVSTDERTRQNFRCLSAAENREAIYRMADDGYTDHVIAAATQLAVEQIRQILAQRHEWLTG